MATADEDTHLVELMASAGYEDGRTRAPSLPPWPVTTEYWQAAARREMQAALRAALMAGYTVRKA